MGRSCGCCNPIGECDFNPCTPWMLNYSVITQDRGTRNTEPLMKILGQVDKFSINFSVEPVNGCNDPLFNNSQNSIVLEFRKIFYLPIPQLVYSFINASIKSFGADIVASVFIRYLDKSKYDLYSYLCGYEEYCCNGLCWRIPLIPDPDFPYWEDIPTDWVYPYAGLGQSIGYTTFPDGNQRVSHPCFQGSVGYEYFKYYKPPSCNTERNISFREQINLPASPWIDLRIRVAQSVMFYHNTLVAVYPRGPSISGSINFNTAGANNSTCRNFDRIIAYSDDDSQNCSYGNFEITKLKIYGDYNLIETDSSRYATNHPCVFD